MVVTPDGQTGQVVVRVTVVTGTPAGIVVVRVLVPVEVVVVVVVPVLVRPGPAPRELEEVAGAVQLDGNSTS